MAFNNPQEYGRPLTVQDEGTDIASNVGQLNFTGPGVTTSVS